MRLEDKEGSCVVKLVGKEAILEERERERKVRLAGVDVGVFDLLTPHLAAG